MRDVLVWGTAVALLLAALHTVHVRREVVKIARDIGRLESELTETVKRNENRALHLEALRSPGPMLRRAQEAGLLGAAATEGGR